MEETKEIRKQTVVELKDILTKMFSNNRMNIQISYDERFGFTAQTVDPFNRYYLEQGPTVLGVISRLTNSLGDALRVRIEAEEQEELRQTERLAMLRAKYPSVVR